MFKLSTASRALQENFRQRFAAMKGERLRSICDVPYLVGCASEPKKTEAPATFERWSYQKIASLLASERLEYSPFAHPPDARRRASNILAVYRAFSVFLLRIERAILFSSVPFPLTTIASPPLSFVFFFLVTLVYLSLSVSLSFIYIYVFASSFPDILLFSLTTCPPFCLVVSSQYNTY